MGVLRLKNKDINIIIDNIREILKNNFNARENPEIFAFGNYLDYLSRNGLILDSDMIQIKNYIFIPASNGGSIAALVILLSIFSGNTAYLRIPRRGLGDEMQNLIDVFLEVKQIRKSLKIYSANEFEHLITKKNVTFKKIIAWGSNKTKKILISMSNSLKSELIYFGSNINATLFDIDLYHELNGSRQKIILDSLISDILTFDQNGCTSTKFIFFKTRDYKKVNSFIKILNQKAYKSRFQNTFSLQAKMSIFFQADLVHLAEFSRVNFSIEDRIWFVNFQELSKKITPVLDFFKSGIVGYMVLDDNTKNDHLMNLSIFNKISVIDKKSTKKSLTSISVSDLNIINLGQSNALDYIWDNTDIRTI